MRAWVLDDSWKSLVRSCPVSVDQLGEILMAVSLQHATARGAMHILETRLGNVVLIDPIVVQFKSHGVWTLETHQHEPAHARCFPFRGQQQYDL